mmetsp:Transcript_8268/g.12235  ORF Transcript_8268/g.12235 Transcript_8268/m.12235 type:complete len:86 (-) Transcript_8268:355-612(-)
MHTNYFIINNSTARKTIKCVTKGLPQFDAVPTPALIVESVDTINSCTLMVPPKDEKVFGVFDFIRKQEADDLERLLSTINVVTQK